MKNSSSPSCSCSNMWDDFNQPSWRRWHLSPGPGFGVQPDLLRWSVEFQKSFSEDAVMRSGSGHVRQEVQEGNHVLEVSGKAHKQLHTANKQVQRDQVQDPTEDYPAGLSAPAEQDFSPQSILQSLHRNQPLSDLNRKIPVSRETRRSLNQD